ncbi:MAG: sigma-54 dependent transcriptional regulator [Myxococcota bacterium]
MMPSIAISSPVDPNAVASAIEVEPGPNAAKPIEHIRLLDDRYEEAGASPAEPHADPEPFCGLLGRSVVMLELFRRIERISPNEVTVLIQGESGVGKELVAKAIHRQSGRGTGPLVAVNCAAIPQSLQDSELFGHEKGAFTGADRARPGRFEQADGGTLFLDEVAELSLEVQAKLLRVLQERRFERVGGCKVRRSNFRLIAATHRNLEQMVQRGEFRLDLFHRLAVIELEVPSLRERADDVALLTHAFLDSFTADAGVERPVLDEATREILGRYRWPGNVRELQNTLQRAVMMCEGGRIRPSDLPARVRNAVEPTSVATPDPAPPSASPVMESLGNRRLADIERAAIEATIKATGGNLAEVTRRLGIGRATLYRRLKKYGLR